MWLANDRRRPCARRRVKSEGETRPYGWACFRFASCALLSLVKQLLADCNINFRSHFVNPHAKVEVGGWGNYGTGTMARDSSCQGLQRVYAHAAADVQLNWLTVCLHA